MDEKRPCPNGAGREIVKVTVETDGTATTHFLSLPPGGTDRLEWILELLGSWSDEKSG